MKLTKLSIASILFGLSASVLAMPNIDGDWYCTSYDPVLQQTTSSTGSIQKMGDKYYLFDWLDYKDDKVIGEARSGIAIHYEKMKNSLAIMTWANNSTERAFGLYKVKSKNKIVGIWTVDGQPTVQETCHRING